MACPIHKIDSNITGLSYAEEVCLKQLPTLALDGADPVWYGLEPNSYSDFGGELSTVARAPIDPSRQNKKGTITDLDASGGFNSDFTLTNLTRLMQGFFFADARQGASSAPLNGVRNAITGVLGSVYTLAAGGAVFTPGQLVSASGFANPANNGLKHVVSSTATDVTVSEVLVDEIAPPTKAVLNAAGRTLATGDISVTVTAGVVSLTAAVADFTTIPGLIVGQWIFIGGDSVTNRFVNNVGFARIKSVSAASVIFDDVTWTPVTEAGAGLAIDVFTGLVIRNEKDPALIKRRTYNIERTLGQGVNGPQAEYLEGAVANEFTLNIPQADKINADLAFTACDNTHRSGDPGDLLKVGTRIPGPAEDAYNTSSNIYRIKMHVHDPNTSSPSALFGYVSEASVSINNNVTPNKAVGVLGAFDVTAGNFEVSGSITAYFTTVSAVKAVRANADVGLSIIAAAKNAGFLFDIPLLGLGGGRINVEKDAPITVPLEPAGAENVAGYTMLYQVFPYLPTVAMPD